MTTTKPEWLIKFEERTEQLIRDNANAPADTVIRAIFEHPDFDAAWDDDDVDYRVGEPSDDVLFKSVDECLRKWYNLDELRLIFRLKCGRKGYVRLIHQDNMAKPCIEDIVDYFTWMEEDAALKDALDYDQYPGYFH